MRQGGAEKVTDRIARRAGNENKPFTL